MEVHVALKLRNVAFVFAQILTLTANGSYAEQAYQNTEAYIYDEGEAPTLASYENGSDTAMDIYLTGYSFWDNTPPGSAAITKPVIHNRAGGTGTYHDPVTVAVGHTNYGGRRSMDFPAGTRFYFPNLQKYGIVEDLCGDGASPQNGPCHSGHNGLAWLDIYIGGRTVGASAAYSCMNRITGVQGAILNPARNYRVNIGEIATSVCNLNG